MKRRSLLVPLCLVCAFFESGHGHASSRQTCPASVQIQSQLGVAGDGWLTACLTRHQASTVLIGLRRLADAPALEVLVAMASEYDTALQAERIHVDQADVRAVLSATPAETPLELSLRGEYLGGPAIRVSVLAASGEDIAIVQEIAVLFRLTEGGPAHLWTGLGGRSESHLDRCAVASRADFELIAADRLRRTLVPLGARKVSPADKTSSCQAPKKMRDTFRLTPPLS